MKASAALLWYALLRVESNGNANYTTIGPFPSKAACEQVVKQETAFCAHGVYSNPSADERTGLCTQISSESYITKDCWSVRK